MVLPASIPAPTRSPSALCRLTDAATLGILLVVISVVATQLPLMGWMLALHIGLFVAYCGLIPLTKRWPILRGLGALSIMFTLYVTLATIPFQAIPWNGDGPLAEVDSWIGLGNQPVVWVSDLVSPTGLAFFSFIYATFIPYLYLSIFLGLIGRPNRERNAFVAGLALTYAISFLGYLFVPAQGPIVFMADQLSAMPDGGLFHRLITESVDNMGGPHGAFPSLHVGASAYLCFFDLRHNRLRGWTYVPLIALIAIATLVTRYHYAVDIVAGLGIAWTAFYLTRCERRSKSAAPGGAKVQRRNDCIAGPGFGPIGGLLF